MSTIEVRTTEVFDQWLRGLRDMKGRVRILARIDQLVIGNPGDVKSVGGGIFEMRVDVGPGYRVYLTRRADILVILLCGGDKDSQARDIRLARVPPPSWRTDPMAVTQPFDSADYLDTPEEIAAYLDAVLEDGDPALVGHALGVVARAKGMSEIARKAGVSRESLYRSLSAEGHPEFATVVKVLKVFGVRLGATPSPA